MKNERPAGYLKCASCQTFVPGKFQTCIYCKTCEEYFHERCFQTETEHDEGNEDTIEEDPLIPVENLAELDVGEASREEAERLLSVKRPGTFLIRHSKTVNQYVLSSSSRKAEGGLRCDHCKISYTEVAGRAYYSLRPGDGRPSLLAAVEINRRHLRLLYPFHSPTSEDLNYVQHDQVFNDEECAEIGDSESKDLHKDDSDSNVNNKDDGENVGVEDLLPFPLLVKEVGGGGETSSGDFNYGDITEEKAEELLCDQVEGTFLLRQDTSGTFKLSRANHTDCQIAQHFVLNTGHKSFFFIPKKKFPSIEDLVEFYQSIDTSNQYWLGLPLLTEKALCKASKDIHWMSERCHRDVMSRT